MVSGWGNNPNIDLDVVVPSDEESLLNFGAMSNEVIPRGLGRSYGDSSLSQNMLSMLCFNRFLVFNKNSGEFICEAGAPLSRIVNFFSLRGWFLAVTPGTKFITVGGAIAANVHGKNHHNLGSFCDFVNWIDILISDGTIIRCSKFSHADLFEATCGGMGLTGIILRVSFNLISMDTAYISKTIKKSNDIKETMRLFEENSDKTYSVAWIDCIGKKAGRSVLMTGEHLRLSDFNSKLNCFTQKREFDFPFYAPNFLLSKHVMKLFNFLYYNINRDSFSLVDYDSFFYPLDSVLNWNKAYGKSGFFQYQFVLPKKESYEGMPLILKKIADSELGSFLAVLKLLGQQKSGIMSFPMEGYTLALDFPAKKETIDLFKELDSMVIDYGGRVYLAKDANMSPSTLINGYSGLDRFLEIKEKYDKKFKWSSLQSKRLGIT